MMNRRAQFWIPLRNLCAEKDSITLNRRFQKASYRMLNSIQSLVFIIPADCCLLFAVCL